MIVLDFSGILQYALYTVSNVGLLCISIKAYCKIPEKLRTFIGQTWDNVSWKKCYYFERTEEVQSHGMCKSGKKPFPNQFYQSKGRMQNWKVSVKLILIIDLIRLNLNQFKKTQECE